MSRIIALIVVALVSGAPTSPSVHPRASTARDVRLVGRWDITITTPTGTAPSWIEIDTSGRDALVGSIVGIVGSARPISEELRLVHVIDHKPVGDVELRNRSVVSEVERILGDSCVVYKHSQYIGRIVDRLGPRVSRLELIALGVALCNLGFQSVVVGVCGAFNQRDQVETRIDAPASSGQRAAIPCEHTCEFAHARDFIHFARGRSNRSLRNHVQVSAAQKVPACGANIADFRGQRGRPLMFESEAPLLDLRTFQVFVNRIEVSKVHLTGVELADGRSCIRLNRRRPGGKVGV